MTKWQPFNHHGKIGRVKGSEGGYIVYDEEHEEGARITLEKDSSAAPWSITCGIYGWMVHTRFFGDRKEAENKIEPMKAAMEKILSTLASTASDIEDLHSDRVADFYANLVDRFPT